MCQAYSVNILSQSWKHWLMLIYAFEFKEQIKESGTEQSTFEFL